MKPALISLAAGASQVPLIEAARERGFHVIGVDRDKNAVGLKSCAEHVVASTHDATEVLAGLKQLTGYSLRGIVARSSGPPVLTAALVADELGLPGLNPIVAHAAVSKSGQRMLARAAGLATPAACTAAPGEAIVAPGPSPWIVKPRITRVGKVAVLRVTRPGDLHEAVKLASDASEDGLAEIERFVDGHDVIVGGVFQGSTWIPCAMFDEDTCFYEGDEAVGLGLASPADLAPEQALKLENLARQLVEFHDLGTGVAFFTFRVEPGAEPVIIEMHLDLGGDYVVDGLLVEQQWNELAVDLATRVPVTSPLALQQARVMRFLFQTDGGERLQSLTKASPTAKVVLDRIHGEGSRGRVGYFLERTQGIEENRRWTERVDQLLARR